jgi:hypothetical protein
MPAARIPLSALRVPEGKLALTLDISGLDPISAIIAVGEIERLVAEVDRRIRPFGSRHDVKTHVFVRRGIDQAMRHGDDKLKEGVMLRVLWLALNHPHHGDHLRQKISQALRQDGKAHLTVTVDATKVWAFALAEKYVDMSQVLEALPHDEHFSLAFDKPTSEQPLQ